MNRDELSVYADQLQIDGDIRGEIIALELLDRPDLAARHDVLMTKWLGFDPRGWQGVRIRFGFVDCVSAQLERVLSTPAAPFVRSLSVAGNNTEIQTALRLVAAAPRPHLARLAIASGRLQGERRRAAAVVDDALAREVIAATPALAFLDLTGNRLFDELPHPTLERLRIVGYDAIAALVDAGAPLRAARSLFYAFASESYGRIGFPEHGLPSTLLARATLPALVELDLSANELQRGWMNRHVALFELLPELGVLPHLARLRLPPVTSDDERDAVAHARGLTSAVIETDGDLPQPLHDSLGHGAFLVVRMPGSNHRISMRRLGELMSAGWSAFDDRNRQAWFALWRVLTSMPFDANYFWDEDVAATAVATTLFEGPLASLEDRVDDDLAISWFAEAVATTGEPTLSVRRSEY